MTEKKQYLYMSFFHEKSKLLDKSLKYIIDNLVFSNSFSIDKKFP